MSSVALVESNRIERVCVITQMLINGNEVATSTVAEQAGVSQRTIQRDLAAISRVLPIYHDNGRWVYAPDGEVSISLY